MSIQWRPVRDPTLKDRWKCLTISQYVGQRFKSLLELNVNLSVARGTSYKEHLWQPAVLPAHGNTLSQPAKASYV